MWSKFNPCISHVTKVSAQTFAGYKKHIQLGKTLYKFPDFINRKYFIYTDFNNDDFNQLHW